MLPQVRKILYATDLGENSLYALGHAVGLAKATGAKVHILHVVPELSTDAKVTIEAYIQSSPDRVSMLEDRPKHSAAHLQKVLADFWDKQSPDDQQIKSQVASVDVIQSYPAETILKVSKEIGCDLIVVGAHEKGVIHTFLGSVAKSVLRRTRIPVLIVPLPDSGEA